MKLIDCFAEGQPLIALISRESWMENKVLLRYGKRLKIVTAWNSQEDFIPSVDDFFAEDWEISTSYDRWLRTEKCKYDDVIKKQSDKPITYGVNILSQCEYIGSVEANSINEAYQIAYDLWCNGTILHNESGVFDIGENIIQQVIVFDESDNQYTFDCREEEAKKDKEKN